MHHENNAPVTSSKSALASCWLPPVFFCCGGLAKPKGSWRFSLRLYRRGLWPLWPWCRRFAQSACLESAPEIQKQLEIEQNDERNVTLANLAKGKAFDIMLYLNGALMVSFVLMQQRRR